MKAILRVAVLSTLIATLAAEDPSHPSGNYDVRFEPYEEVTMADGVKLHMSGYRPEPRSNATRFPVLLFPNSWSLPVFEYFTKTLNYAGKGYIAMGYETRGWYESGGEIDCAGPLDISDAKAMLTHLLGLSAWQPDPDSIAFVGISYGGGISLLMGALDDRVGTVVAMSGWGNLTDMAMMNDTPNTLWGGLLVDLGELVGHPSPDIKALFDDVNTHTNVTFVHQFGAVRSPVAYIDVLSKKNVFLSHNRLDRLFRSEGTLDLYTKFTNKTNKFAMFNQGIHAEPEMIGLIDGFNVIWENSRQWLDWHLMGEPTDISQAPPVQFQLGDDIGGTTFVQFDSWPSVASVPENWFLGSRGGFIEDYGLLCKQLPCQHRDGAMNDTLRFTDLPALSVGVPVLESLLRSIDLETNTDLALADRHENLVFRSDPLSADTRYCGAPTLNFTVSANDAAWQMYAFLYDIDLLGGGRLVADAFYTHWGPSPVAGDLIDGVVSFHTLCRTFPAGHRVGLGLTLFSALYNPANKDSKLRVTVHTEHGAHLTMPLAAV